MTEIRKGFIAVEGNIGAGKTSLATRLAESLNAALMLEEFAENSFLPLFYEDPGKYAFPLELSFLTARHRQHLEVIENQNGRIVSDYHFQKSLLFAAINLDRAELDIYKSIFNIVSSQIPEPELVIFLKNDSHRLLSNIRNRGRAYEQSIELSYLEKINKGYSELLHKYQFSKIIEIDAGRLDFVNKPGDFTFILNLIYDKL